MNRDKLEALMIKKVTKPFFYSSLGKGRGKVTRGDIGRACPPRCWVHQDPVYLPFLLRQNMAKSGSRVEANFRDLGTIRSAGRKT